MELLALAVMLGALGLGLLWLGIRGSRQDVQENLTGGNMEVGKVRTIKREVATHSVKVKEKDTTLSLFVDEENNVTINAVLSDELSVKVAKFGGLYLPAIHAAIGAVLEAMGEDA